MTKNIGKNDFLEQLNSFINMLNLPIPCRMDYLDEDESLVCYPLAGGKVNTLYMDEAKDVTLPFEIAIKTKNHSKANTCIWAINEALSEFNLELPSKNGSYEFDNLTVTMPFLNDRDDQGYYIYLQDIQANITVFSK